MEKRFPLAGGRGWLAVREEGGRVRCEARMPDDGRGLYKGWLTGASGRALLGTFVPGDGGLALARTLSLDELKRQGAWPPEEGTAELAFSFDGRAVQPPGWTRDPSPGRLLGEPLLAAAAPGPALLRREAEGFSLAYRYRPDRPFPLTPLFCFARLEEMEGELYLCFPFRKGGCPRLEEL